MSDEWTEEREEREAAFRKALETIASGYAGTLSNGNIVDRREHQALPIEKNALLGVPEPKTVASGDGKAEKQDE